MPVIYLGSVNNREGAVSIPTDIKILVAECTTESKVLIKEGSPSPLLLATSLNMKPIEVVLTAEGHDQTHDIHVIGRERPQSTITGENWAPPVDNWN